MSFDFKTSQANKDALARIVAKLKAMPREKRGYSIRNISPGDVISDLEVLIAEELDRAREEKATGERIALPAGTVLKEGELAPSVDADPWLDALTLTVANAVLSGLERGVPSKEGVARIAAAFQAGVDLAIPPPTAK